MPPANRGPRWPTGVERGEEEASQDVLAVSSVMLLTPSRANEGTVEMVSSVLMSTPQAGGPSPNFFGTADLSRPVTRSTAKGRFDSILAESPLIQSQAQRRLLHATTRSGGRETTASRLEEARDVNYRSIEDNDQESHDDREAVGQTAESHSIIEETPRKGPEVGHPPAETTEMDNIIGETQNDGLGDGHPQAVGGLCAPRRSDRIRAKSGPTGGSPQSSTLSASASNNNRIQKRRKKTRTKTSSVVGALRRSARLAKPLDIFHKYRDLPPELRLMIWEAAIQPRLTYICNRWSVLEHAHSFGVQNKFPTWFLACRLSVYIAKRNYQTLFGQNSMTTYPGTSIPLRPQAVNPFVDIVVYEPCHSGCRGFYCAQQYRREDRAAVQRLAVQIDSAHLPLTSEPGWITISRSWPNVETLFMMKPAVRGLDQSDKAMIRIKEGDHELTLRKHFESWKKGVGQDHKLKTLEFVRVVAKEAETKNIQDRYQSIEDRKTGFVEDIVLG
ncbi:hypothetical protein O1611_g2764 [Lasiodiplodia mahajangana]|uniref:Uncharacterized protein n=1 Tax=Lasiodiplodia mahajangana TaxID=1108764 RepID=A0ACC2JU64_9PEZI|nr:hypothetical protein O1611_g2764 [Lasiodiplodia mahajangana]